MKRLFFAVFLFGCAGEDTDPVECVSDPPLEYDNFGRGFLQAYCTGCHAHNVPEGLRNDAPVGVDFDTYEMVLQWKDRIRFRADLSLDDPMPPGGGPTEADYERFHEWLDCAVTRDWEIYDAM